ncbi:hypothetical protein BGZ83_011470 [Gryganskiella cystojenkinii]|nr:hypothetical protein BGZ83_011470 [Gryganskiella cystojenkinii]
MAARFSFSDVRYSALNHSSRNKRLWTILLAICFLLALSLIHIQVSLRSNGVVSADCSILSKGLDQKRKTFGKSWIVVTTINQPTAAMDLLCNLEGWNVVVVADTKSPKDWKCGSCVYLSVEDQTCLSYGIVEVIPYKAYTRKNIGYLWAIQQGATRVFDTDDDNLPTGKDIILESPTASVVGYRADKTTGKSVNIYSHFGRPDIWPRGFPLEEIDIRRPVAYIPEYDSLPKRARDVLAPPMMIQQGLADLDPDVDAIFRLTQGQELKQAKFCKKSPSIRLSPGTFCPFNSQNTLFSYDAFWGLVLPITVSFRVCDIWRGYWVQRLLWDVDGSLGFTKPTVDQIRNAHNYLADYMDELQIYSETSKFIEFLSSWTSPSTSLETRIMHLMKGMAENKFIGEADVDLAQRWVKDLKSIGYVFPNVTGYDPQAVKTSLTEFEEPRLNAQKSRQLSNEALQQCLLEAEVDPAMSSIKITPSGERDHATARDKFKDILVIVNFNHPTYDAIKPYLFMYESYFPNIKFYGPMVPAHLKDNVTENNPYDGGATGYRSLIGAMEKYPDYKGYLYTNDDTVLNVFQIARFDQDKVWKQVPDLATAIHDRSKPHPKEWHVGRPEGAEYMWDKPETGNMWSDPTSLTDKQRQRIAAFTKVDGPVDIRAFVDAVYVPGRIAVELTDVLKRFLKHNAFLELAVGLALVAVEPPENWHSWNESYLWYEERVHWRDAMVPGVGMIHPVKVAQDLQARNEIVHFIESVAVV